MTVFDGASGAVAADMSDSAHIQSFFFLVPRLELLRRAGVQNLEPRRTSGEHCWA
ncbi:hypothetical protein WMF18_13060 [Sorangium sp. So ce315]|uniref:hypothetical protein n=1 Tax=Sorangium sp. So ce315 TaxID=3133299 RepID=UPI003F611656